MPKLMRTMKKGEGLTVGHMVLLIAQRRHVLIDRGDHPNTGPYVFNVLLQMTLAMKQLCNVVALVNLKQLHKIFYVENGMQISNNFVFCDHALKKIKFLYTLSLFPYQMQ